MSPVLTIVFVLFSAAELFILWRFAKSSSPFTGETALSYLGFSLYLLLHVLFRFPVPDYQLILVMLTIIGTGVFGNYLEWYQKSKTYDRYLHAFGSFSFALFGHSLLLGLTSAVIEPKAVSALLVVLSGLSLGVIFELVEFAHDRMAKPKKQKGLYDTDLDLLFDVIGSVAAGIFFYLFLS